jgi:hypothetical protein
MVYPAFWSPVPVFNAGLVIRGMLDRQDARGGPLKQGKIIFLK